MLATAEKVMSFTIEAHGEGEGDHDSHHQLSNDVYMETMRSLQFGQPLSLMLLDCLHVVVYMFVVVVYRYLSDC